MPGARTLLRKPEGSVATCRCRVWETNRCGGVGVAVAVGVGLGERVTLEVEVGACTSPCIASCGDCVSGQLCCRASGHTQYNGGRDGSSQMTERR
jgi:hypothetical protein